MCSGQTLAVMQVGDTSLCILFTLCIIILKCSSVTVFDHNYVFIIIQYFIIPIVT